MANIPVPSPRTFTVGETEAGAYFNATRDALIFLLGLPVALIYQTISQTLTTADTAYALSCDSTEVDSYGGHSNSTNNSRYTAQVAGWHLVAGAICFSPTTSGIMRKAQVYLNGTGIPYAAAQVPNISSSSFGVAVAISPTVVFMNAGDYVEIYATCDVAGLHTTPNSGNESYMTVFWVHN